MPIRCDCGHCKTEFWAPDKFAGRTLGCPVCEKWVLVPGGPPRPPEPVKPEPLPDLLDEALGPAAALSGGEDGGGIGTSHLDEAWASDGTWRGTGRRSRREIVRIPLQAGIAIFAIGALVFCLLIIATVPKSAAVIGWIVFWTAGVGLILLGLGWEALIAMRERAGPGIFVLIPPLNLFYFMSQWDKARKALLTVLAGMAVCGGSFGTIRLAEYLAGRQEEQPASSRRPGAATGATPQPAAGKASKAAEAQGRAPVPPASPAATANAGRGRSLPAPGQVQPATVAAVAAAPEDDPAIDPVGRAYVEASRQYAIQAAVDLIAGDDAALQYRMRWFPAGKRPVIGLRWGLGVEVSDPSNPAVRAAVTDGEALIGSAALALVAGLEGRIKAGAFGEWPDQGDPRCRQVAILPTGTRGQLVAAARSRRLDMLILLQLVPLSSAAGRVTQTLVQAEVFDVIADGPLWTSEAVGAAAGGARGPVAPAGDPVAVWVGDVLAHLRDHFELVPVPDLTAEEVRTRLKQSGAEKGRAESALLLLVELRYYQLKRLLPVEEAANEQDALLGPGRGRLLATQPPAKRRELIQAWVKGLGTRD